MKSLIREELKTDTCAWQAILNVFYNKWQADEYKSYNEMIEAAEKVNPLYAYAILVGKYNQQVCNGGHIQYFDNGYASADSGGCFSDKTDIKLHEKLIELHKQFFPDCPEKETLGFILNDFMDRCDAATKDCEWCDDGNEFYYDDEEEDSYHPNEPCTMCNGDGYITATDDSLEYDSGYNGERGYQDPLNSKYYALKIEELLDNHFAKVIPESLEN